MAATVTMILVTEAVNRQITLNSGFWRTTTYVVTEVVNRQITLNSGFWRTTTCITVKILYYRNADLSTTTSLLTCFPPWTYHSPWHIALFYTHTLGRRSTVGILTWTAVDRTCKHWQHGWPCTVTVRYGILNGLSWHTHMQISKRGWPCKWHEHMHGSIIMSSWEERYT